MTSTLTDEAEPPIAVRRRTVLRGGLWSAANQLLPAAGTAVLSVVAARMLGSSALGRQSLIAYVNAATSGVVVRSLTGASLRELGRLEGSGDQQRFAALAAWTRHAHVIAGTMVFLAMLATGLLVGRDEPSWAIIGAVSLIDAFSIGIAVRAIARDGWAPYGRLSLGFQMLGPPLGTVAVIAGLGIPGIFLGDGVAAFGLLVAVALLLNDVGPGGRRTAGPDVRPGGRGWSVLRPPVPMARTWWQFSMLELMTEVVSRRVEFMVLIVLSTSREIAMYSVAFIFVSLLGMVPTAVAHAALPMIAAAEGGGSLQHATFHLRQAVRLAGLLTLPLASLAAALGPTVVLVVYGPEFADAARLVPLATPALLVAVAIGMCTQYWSGRGQARLVIRVSLVAAVIDIGVAVALTPGMGAAGAVIANVVGQAVLAAGLVRVTVRRIGPLGWQLTNLLAMVVASVAGGASAAVVVTMVNGGLAVDGGVVRSTLAVIAGGLVGLLMTAVVGAALKVLERSEAQWLEPLLPRRCRPVLALFTSGRRPAAAPADARC